MKKQTTKKQLTLRAETVRSLNRTELVRVGGGAAASYPSDADGCGSDSSDPQGSGSAGGSGYVGYLP